MELLDTSQLDLSSAYQQLGMTDYVYLQTADYIDKLENYRSLLIKRITELHNGNGESMDDPRGLQTNN